MSLDEQAARELAEAKLASQTVPGGPVITKVEEFPVGWVFYWTSARYLETRNLSDALGGNSPVLVDRSDGSVHFTGTARPTAEYVQRYLDRDPADERSWHP